MWIYEKKLQFPVNIKKPDPKLAQVIITQFGGPDGELTASQRYLSQRYSMPYKEVVGVLTDIGTEELAHMEMICAIVHQLTRDLTEEQIKNSPFATYYVDHTTGLYPVAASGVPFTVSYFQSKGDAVADINEDLAADGAILYGQPRCFSPAKSSNGSLREPVLFSDRVCRPQYDRSKRRPCRESGGLR